MDAAVVEDVEGEDMAEAYYAIAKVVAEDPLWSIAFVERYLARFLVNKIVELANELEAPVVLERLSDRFQPGE